MVVQHVSGSGTHLSADRMKHPKLEVLPTRYAGCHFRSRLEARWAVFMDALGVKWQYEPEGYKLPAGKYLPDFFLPVLDCFFELKPTKPTQKETAKCAQLSEFTGKTVFLMVGQPAVPNVTDNWYDGGGAYYFKIYTEDSGEKVSGWDEHYLWCECPHCHRCELQFDGRADRIRCKCPPSAHGDKGYNYDSDRLKKAYTLARSHRFGT
jgi:hypothetical protein